MSHVRIAFGAQAPGDRVVNEVTTISPASDVVRHHYPVGALLDVSVPLRLLDGTACDGRERGHGDDPEVAHSILPLFFPRRSYCKAGLAHRREAARARAGDDLSATQGVQSVLDPMPTAEPARRERATAKRDLIDRSLRKGAEEGVSAHGSHGAMPWSQKSRSPEGKDIT